MTIEDSIARELGIDRTEAAALTPSLLHLVGEQLRAVRALQESLERLTSTVSPEQAARSQATENIWRLIAQEFGLLTGREVAARLGSRAKNAGGFASDLRRRGELMAVKRRNAYLYPGYQFNAEGRVRPLMKRLAALAHELDVDEETVLLWMRAPSTWFEDESRPVDNLNNDDAVCRAFEDHFGINW
ncbi:hypothetical protein [Crystallibacter degradans]|uniref:hypothetical protein n=1 Tax=Crystallibacter degradans TaxID=2726743 RepID=UPI0014758A42|nr:hypothetical protein [Arthrobacter sp. SF27]NMR29192.1 hypothetical protein [Arthrobacter sp. SF27]